MDFFSYTVNEDYTTLNGLFFNNHNSFEVITTATRNEIGEGIDGDYEDTWFETRQISMTLSIAPLGDLFRLTWGGDRFFGIGRLVNNTLSVYYADKDDETTRLIP